METTKIILVKINFDVAFQNHTKKSCSGIVAVQMGLNLGFMEVMIEGDALAIVKKLHANHDDRKENGLTHLLDSEGICKGETTYMVEGVPPFATSEVEKDMWWTDPSD
ncbi:hypothetical protein GOBAR_AA29054 [Gossypium barbadense]|uniref:RNase H type-1 domain-containing protein n=1 Tax=Gossypium barbadense TaxID=3634 RepID=A0A2P5WKL0_GOSBA|nr:hypothetical protein GOBAR_AA29054 [Gossypium barbadense]